MNLLELKRAFRKEGLAKGLVNIEAKRSDEVVAIIKQDCDFLQRNGLMDYSMNLVVESRPYEAQDLKALNTSGRKNVIDMRQLKRNEFLSQDGLEVYHLGIIDYLQTWNP